MQMHAKGGWFMVIGIFLYVLAIIIGLAFGVFQHVPNQRKTVGTIESLEYQSKDSENTPTYTVVVAYIVDGVTYFVKSSYQSSSFQKKKKMVVYYNSEIPQQGFIRTQIEIYVFIVTIIGIGTILIIRGIFNI